MVYRLQGWQTTTLPAFGGNAADTPAALPPAQVPAVRSRASTPSLRRPHDRERHRAVPAGSTCRNQNRPILKRFPEFAVLFQKPDKAALSERLIAKFDAYLSAAKAETIDLNGATVTEIVAQYFSEAPPFGPGTKKSEFPDAIALSALITWCKRNDETVYVITRDNDIYRKGVA